MEIFYLNLKTFINALPAQEVETLLTTYGRHFSSKKRRVEYALGRYLVKNIAKKFYDLENVEIGVKNNKPFFLNQDLNFSISHSKDIVLVAFSKHLIGADVEFMRKRDFCSILARLNIVEENPTCENFYKHWTAYEAKIKLQDVTQQIYTYKILPEYMLTLCTNTPAKENIEFYEVTQAGYSICQFQQL